MIGSTGENNIVAYLSYGKNKEEVIHPNFRCCLKEQQHHKTKILGILEIEELVSWLRKWEKLR